MRFLEVHHRALIGGADSEVFVELVCLLEAFFHADEDDRCVPAAEADEVLDALPVDGGEGVGIQRCHWWNVRG